MLTSVNFIFEIICCRASLGLVASGMAFDWTDDDYVDLLPTGLLVPHYLIHCYLYYEAGASVISDSQFDGLARRLDLEWEDVKHRHKRLIDRAALGSGGAYLTRKLPCYVTASAESVLRLANHAHLV